MSSSHHYNDTVDVINLCNLGLPKSLKITIRGLPFMTSTRRGEGIRLRWTHVDGGRGFSPMWTSTQKIKIRAHRCHTVFFSCKEVGVFFFYQNFVFGQKKWTFFCDIN